MAVTITFLGTRGDIEIKEPKHRFHSSTLFESDGTRILLDYGKDAPPLPSDLDAAINSHSHSDHLRGLKAVDPKAPVYVSRYTIKSEYFDARDFAHLDLKVFAPRSTFRIKDVKVTSVPVLHSVKAPNVALFLDFPGGIRICYATDVLALRKADRDRLLKETLLYIGDGASLKRTLARIARGTDVPIGHQSIEGQIAWAREAGVKHIVFTHFGEWALKLDERSLKRELE